MLTMVNTTFSQRLKQSRTDRGLNQRDAARRFGVSQASYNRWEKGVSTPDMDRWQQLATFIGATLEELWELLNVDPDQAPPAGDLEQRIAILETEMAELRAIVNQLAGA